MKIIVLVEGKTEDAFKDHLRKFLKTRLVRNNPLKLDFHRYDGRIPKEDKLKRIVKNYLSHHGYDAVIALTDVYTGTHDFKDAHDAKAKMLKWVGSIVGFYPHAAQHDFEAWLLPYWPKIQKLAGHDKKPPRGNPERVNHTKPPSKYIQEIFEIGSCRDSYKKPRDGNRILEGQDLLVSANACSELKAFLNTVLRLSGGALIP
jgi:hypothetical protein